MVVPYVEMGTHTPRILPLFQPTTDLWTDKPFTPALQDAVHPCRWAQADAEGQEATWTASSFCTRTASPDVLPSSHIILFKPPFQAGLPKTHSDHTHHDVLCQQLHNIFGFLMQVLSTCEPCSTWPTTPWLSDKVTTLGGRSCVLL